MSKNDERDKMIVFKNRIDELIADDGCLRSEIHKKIGIGNSTLSKVSSYGIIPKLTTLVKMADYFKVSLDYLLGKVDFDNFVPSKSNKSFMDRLNELKDSKGIATYYELAKNLHIPRQTVNDWKNNGYYPNLEILESLADYFDVPMDYLLGRID